MQQIFLDYVAQKLLDNDTMSILTEIVIKNGNCILQVHSIGCP